MNDSGDTIGVILIGIAVIFLDALIAIGAWLIAWTLSGKAIPAVFTITFVIALVVSFFSAIAIKIGD